MENTENKSILTTLNISNTDIVTMLIAEKKDQLRAEVDTLKVEKNEILIPYLEAVKAKMDKAIASPEYIDFKEQLYAFAKLYNPKIDIKIDTNKSFEYQMANLIANCYSIHKCDFRLNSLTIEYEEDDENKFEFPFRDDYIQLPKKLDKKFSLNISVEDIDKYNDVISKISHIDSRLRNTDKIKEEMVAAMTKQAIMNNPDLLAIRASVLQISE